MKDLYTANATATGNGRNGLSATDDGRVTVTLATPTEMGGTGKGTNPEQLFATGYAACYLGAMRHVASNHKINMPADAKITSHVTIAARDDGEGFAIHATLDVSLPGMEKAAAEDLAAKTHVVCPYSYTLAHGATVKTNIV